MKRKVELSPSLVTLGRPDCPLLSCLASFEHLHYDHWETVLCNRGDVNIAYLIRNKNSNCSESQIFSIVKTSASPCWLPVGMASLCWGGKPFFSFFSLFFSSFILFSCWPPVGIAPLCWGGKPCDKNCCCRDRNCCSSSATTWITTLIKIHLTVFFFFTFSLDIKMFSAWPRHLCQQQVFFQCQTWVWRSHRCSIGLVSRWRKREN